ncbi:hypothetical protein [Streptomyces sp. AJS327]|nr:hypothetical protein [Streptomyces sp. AJS327]
MGIAHWHTWPISFLDERRCVDMAIEIRETRYEDELPPLPAVAQ